MTSHTYDPSVAVDEEQAAPLESVDENEGAEFEGEPIDSDGAPVDFDSIPDDDDDDEAIPYVPEDQIDAETPLLAGDLENIAEKQRREDAEKLDRVRSEYNQHLRQLGELQAFTENPRWHQLYQYVEGMIQKHHEDLVTCEKPREIVAHQVGVSQFRQLVEYVLLPWDRFNRFVADHGESYMNRNGLTWRAEWDSTNGKVTLYDAAEGIREQEAQTEGTAFAPTGAGGASSSAADPAGDD